MYCTIEGVKRKLQDDLYDETEIDDTIEATDPDVIAWINTSTRQASGFTEMELTTTHTIIRLAADCYASCRIMSEVLEAHNMDDGKEVSLAVYRCNEAKEHIRMWCAINDVIPAFDDLYIPPTTPVTVSSETGIMFANAIGEDDVCIG